MYFRNQVAYHHPVPVTTEFTSSQTTEPIAVHPYRYPQLQKNKLKAQCIKMLQQAPSDQVRRRSLPQYC
jgi:hypothetical protein